MASGLGGYQGADAALATALRHELSARTAAGEAALGIGALVPATAAEAIALAKAAESRAAHPYLLERARARARLVAVMHRQASIGRGGLVDREVLEKSDAVSKQKLDEVTVVATRCGGDAARLLEALDNKAVKGFQERKIAELRDDLERRGYLDAQRRRSPLEIRVAMVGAMADDIAAGVLEETDVDRLLRRIQQRASPARRVPTDAMATLVIATP